MAVGIFSFLILVSIVSVIGAIVAINKLKKETETHKKAMVSNKSMLPEHPNSDIVSYIMNARRQGFPDSHIMTKLKEEGWSKEIIKKYV